MAVAGIGMVACGGERMPPQALSDARAELVRAKSGPAARLDPTDVHQADLALARAEKAWQDDPDDPSTVDVAIIAHRRALIAEAEAAVVQAEGEAATAKQTAQALVSQKLQNTRGQLGQTEQQLGATQQQLQTTQQEAAAQRQALLDMAAKLKDARDTIAKIATVKDDDRGMVITLQGEVLFKTGKSDLKAGAMAKLDQIAEALKGKDQPIVVYGFTDNVGTVDNNMDLSRRRAESVRDYLVSKGIPQDLVTAQGKGVDNPVADNTSIEGRAQNRRVEIVVQPKR
jgi:outer membrane protein OmpA-like peptidoglycan-associated protein